MPSLTRKQLTRKQLDELCLVGSISGDRELCDAARSAMQSTAAMSLCVRRKAWIDTEIALQRAVSAQAADVGMLRVPAGRAGRAVVIHCMPEIRSVGSRTTTRDIGSRSPRPARTSSWDGPSFGGDEVRS